MNSTIVKIEKSGNRFNAWDADGNKHELKGRNEAIYEIINTHF